MPSQQFLTPAELCKRWKISRRKLQYMTRDGTAPCPMRIGRNIVRYSIFGVERKEGSMMRRERKPGRAS